MCENLFTGSVTSVPNVMTFCDGKQGFCRRKTALSEWSEVGRCVGDEIGPGRFVIIYQIYFKFQMHILADLRLSNKYMVGSCCT